MCLKKFPFLIFIFSVVLFSSMFMFAQTSFTEDFSSDPSLNGWSYSGINTGEVPTDPQLFVWNESQQRLDFTLNAGKSENSVFIKMLNGVVDQNDSFEFSFKFYLTSLTVDTNDWPFFQMAVGLRNTEIPAGRVWDRGGKSMFDPDDDRICIDIVEWNHIPNDPAFMFPTIVTKDEAYHNNYLTPGTALTTGVLYEITHIYQGGELTLSMTADGVLITTADVTTPVTIYVGSGDQFECNAFAVNNYFNRWDGNSTPDFVAEGWIDDIEFVYTPASADNWQVYE